MSELIACHGCDLLVDISGLEDNCRADCPRCGYYLTRYQHDAMNRVLAYTIAALILLALACSFPFLSFSASGIESVMTLPGTPESLILFGMVLLLIVLVSAPLLFGLRAPWLRIAARGLFTLQTWSMVEVFIIAVIVSLVKIASLATVVLGISFWAYTAFSICFTLALVTLDRYQCWEMIEALDTAK